MNYILALAIWLNIVILHQKTQTGPVSIYISETLYKSIPTKDGKGFTYTTAVNVEGKFKVVFCKDRIILHTTDITKLFIDRIESKIKSEASYYVHDSSGKRYLIVLATSSTEKKVYSYIDYYTMDHSGAFTSLTKINCRKQI